MNWWEDQRTSSLNTFWRRWHFVMCENCFPMHFFEDGDTPINAHWVVWVWGIYIAFKGHICGWHICGSSMSNLHFCCFLTEMCSNVGYISRIWHQCSGTCAMWQAYLFRGNCQWFEYIPVFLVTLLIVLSSYEAYILTSLSHMCHELIGIFGMYVALEKHICWWHIYDNSMVIKSCSFFGLVCAVMWGLYVDHNSSVVGQMFAVGDIFV